MTRRRTKRKLKIDDVDPKLRLKVALEMADDNLPDGAYWAMVHEMAGLEYGDAFDMMEDDPAYYGIDEVTKQ